VLNGRPTIYCHSGQSPIYSTVVIVAPPLTLWALSHRATDAAILCLLRILIP